MVMTQWLTSVLTQRRRTPLPTVEDAVDGRKRQIFLVLLPLGSVFSAGDAVKQWLTGSGNPFNLWADCILAACLLVLFFLAWYSVRFQRTAEIGVYLLAASYLLANLSVDLFNATRGPVGDLAGEISGWGQWLLVVYLVGFLSFTPRESATLATLIYLVTWGIGAVYVWPSLLDGRTPPGLYSLIQFYIASGISLAFLYRIGSLRQHYALTDFLTGVANRRHLYHLLTYEIDKARRYDLTFSILLFDVDHFKRVNDVYGHQVGDRVLKELTQLTRNLMRRVDVLGRWGGEEFLLVLPATDVHGAARLAERLRSAMAQHRFEDVDAITASFGVTAYQWSEAAESLVDRADQALYQAKNDGRNRVVVRVSDTPADVALPPDASPPSTSTPISNAA